LESTPTLQEFSEMNDPEKSYESPDNPIFNTYLLVPML